MSRRLATGDVAGAHHAQSRTMALTIALTAPFFIAFVTLPELIVAGLFMHGKFTATDAYAAGDVLSAYGGGLLALVLIASARASFQARGDTSTPMKVALIALAVNVVMKVVLFFPLGAVGIATATSIGLWINFGALIALAIKRDEINFDQLFAKTACATIVACGPLAFIALNLRAPIIAISTKFGSFSNITALIIVGVIGALIYAIVFLSALHLQGVDLRSLMSRRR